MANNLHLKVVLEALDKASGPINDIVRSSKSLQRALVADAEEFKKLKDVQRDTGAFRRAEIAIAETGNALQQAKRKLDQMAQAYQAAESPTVKMTNALHKQGNAVRGLTERQQRQRQELAITSGKLQQAGVDTHRLALHEARLASEISKANDKLKVQQQRLQQVGEAAARGQRVRNAGMAIRESFPWPAPGC